MNENYSNEYLNGLQAERATRLKAWARSRLAAADSFDQPAAQGGISDFAFFDPLKERLSNLIQGVPAVANPVTEFLAAKEDDGRLEGRLKNTLEGLGLGAATEAVAKTLGSGLRAYKKVREARAAVQARPTAAEEVFRGLNEAVAATKPLSALGDIDGAVVARGEARPRIGEAATYARATETLEARQAQRMIKSDHPYGWSGPAKEMTTVHQNADEPLRWIVETSEGSKEVSLPELIKFRNNGQLNKRNTKNILLKHAGNIYERFELTPVEIPGGGGIRGLLPVNEHNAFLATLGKGDIRHMIIQAKNEADFLAIQSIPDIWRTSVYEGTGDWIVKGGTSRPHSESFLGVHTFKNKIEIKGDIYDVTITVRETDTGKNYYHQKTTKIDKKAESGDNPRGLKENASSDHTVTVVSPDSSEFISQTGG
jgi:hypothetical protein